MKNETFELNKMILAKLGLKTEDISKIWYNR
jgi:hypothetical protein